MANTLESQSLTLVDWKRYTSTSKWYQSADTAANGVTLATAMIAAVEGCSNASGYAGRGPVYGTPAKGARGINAEFPNIEDKVVFQFVTTNERLLRLHIPAPKIAIFQADGMTVDFTQANVVTLVDLLENTAATPYFVCGPIQEPISTVVSGFRQRAKNRRRISTLSIGSDGVSFAM